MEGLLELAAEKCQSQMQRFLNCIDTNPADWDQQCLATRIALIDCTEPIVENIRTQCTDQMQRFEQCAARHPNEPHMCVEEVEQLQECAQQNTAHNLS